MKYLLFLSFLLIAQPGLSQCDSTFFRSTATLLRDVVMIDTNRMVAVGSYGNIIKSTDGGNNWRNIRTSTSNTLFSVCLASDSVLYVAGYDRTILKSEDQGESWFPLYVKPPVSIPSVFTSFFDVFFVNKDTGFVVGAFSYLYTTYDGGRTWKDTLFPYPPGGPINTVTFVNDTLGFLSAGPGGLFRTKNAGKSWENIYADPAKQINRVKFLDALTAFAFDGNQLHRSTDGGLSWTTVTMPSQSVNNDVFFINAQTGLFASHFGGIFKTTDAGVTWNRIFDNSGYIYSVSTDKLKKKILFVGGSRDIFSTSDEGLTFHIYSVNSGQDHYDLSFLNDSTGYVAGSMGVFKTTDRAETWQKLKYIPASPVRSVFFLDQQYGYAGADKIYRTRDSGRNWIATTVPEPGQINYQAKRLHFFDPSRGLAMDNNSLYHTSDSGATWSLIFYSPDILYDFTFKSNGAGFLVGGPGKLYTSTNQGLTWAPVSIGTTDELTTVYFYNNTTGFIGSSDSAIFKTVDGGNSWNKIYDSLLTPNIIGRSFFFVNDSVGYHSRDNWSLGGLYETKNGGQKWRMVVTNGSRILKLAGRSTVYAVGDAAQMIRTDRPQLPSRPGYIYGPDANCENTVSHFRTGMIDSVKYHWSVSGGGVQRFAGIYDTVQWNGVGSKTVSLTVSNVCGMSPARTLTVQVNPATVITTSPQNVSACFGSTANFTVTATGVGLKYQWKKNGTDIPGAINASFSVSNITATEPGNYSVTVTGLCGSITSPAAILSMKSGAECTTALPTVRTHVHKMVIYPNPVKDITTVKLFASRRTQVSWIITDINGSIVRKISGRLMAGENVIEFSLGNLPAGVYQIDGITDNFKLQGIRLIKLDN